MLHAIGTIIENVAMMDNATEFGGYFLAGFIAVAFFKTTILSPRTF